MPNSLGMCCREVEQTDRKRLIRVNSTVKRAANPDFVEDMEEKALAKLPKLNLGPEVSDAVVDFLDIVRRFQDVEGCIKLAKAAEFLQVKNLGEFSLTLLKTLFEQNRGYIWRALTNGYKVQFIADACVERLSKNTESMLECKEFLEIRPEALAFFLAIEGLNIDSEFTLVKASIRYARSNGKSDEHVKELFQKYALPHLRVLTLTYQQLLQVNEFLTLEQALFLHDNLQNKEPLLTVEDLPEIEKSFSLNKKRRFPDTCCTLTVVPEEDVLPLTTVFKEGMFSVWPSEENKFVMAFEATTKFVIRRIEVFCPLDLRGESDFLDENLMKRLRESEIDCDSKITTPLTVRIKIRENQGTLKGQLIEEVILDKPKEEIYLNSQWASFYGAIKVPESTKVKLKVSYKGRVSLRHFETNVERIIQENDRCVRKLFDNVELDQFYKDGENGFRCVREGGITVFKDIHVCPCDKPDDVTSPAEKNSN